MDTIVYLYQTIIYICMDLSLYDPHSYCTACKQMSLHLDRKINSRILLVIYRAFKYMAETGISAGACMQLVLHCTVRARA